MRTQERENREFSRCRHSVLPALNGRGPCRVGPIAARDTAFMGRARAAGVCWAKTPPGPAPKEGR
ncbi:hypothetical protein LC55x_4077 [Lysobacter capsici]|nr:hypothetical protein LC55x_4077 [Lysobacter capsici]